MPEEVKYQMSLNDLVTPKLNQAEGAATRFETKLGSVQGSLSRLGEKALSIGTTLGISFAFIKLEEFAHAGVEAAHKVAQAEAQVKAGLISTNHAAGISYEELEDSARGYAKQVAFSRAEIMQMQSVLLTFPGVSSKVFNTASEEIMDMSTRLHKGLDETAVMVGKALQDPIRGITAMRRVGVNFSSTQTEIIKKLVETGHAGRAQILILKELQTEFGGSALAAANADPLFRYNKIMGSLKMAIGQAGEALLHDLTPGLETAANGFKWAYDKGSQFIGYIQANAAPILKEVKADLIGMAIGLGIAVAAYAIANPTVIVYTGALIANGIATVGLTVATYAMTAAQWLLNAAVSANPFVLLGIAIVGVGLYLGHLYNTSAKFRAVLSGIGEVVKDLGVVFKGLGETIIGALTFNPATIRQGFSDMVTGAKDIGSAFKRGYDQSIHESQLAEAKENAGHSTIGKEAAKKKAVAPQSTKAGTTTTSKVSGSKVLNINIKIDNVIKEFSIKTTNLKEGTQKAHDMVANALLSAINDSQIATDM